MVLGHRSDDWGGGGGDEGVMVGLRQLLDDVGTGRNRSQHAAGRT